MLTLPPLSVRCCGGVLDCALPCPAVDVIRLATALARAPECPQSIERLLTDNPSWLVYSAFCFFNTTDSAVDSVSELADWCESHLLQQINSVHHVWVSVGRVISEECLSRFARADNSGRLKKSLVGFLVESTGCRKKIAKHVIGDVFSSEFRWDFLGAPPATDSEFGGTKSSTDKRREPIRRSKKRRPAKQKLRCRSILEAWNSSIALSVDVGEILATGHQLAQLQAEFDERLLGQKLAAMKQLAYGASHEINNPLANIATRAQTLLTDESDPERRHKLAVIYEQAMRAHEMISDLMLFSNPPRPPIRPDGFANLALRRDCRSRPFLGRDENRWAAD